MERGTLPRDTEEIDQSKVQGFELANTISPEKYGN